MKKTHKPTYHYHQAQLLWAQIQTLPPKEKYSQLKNLCFSLVLSDSPTLEEIEFFCMLCSTYAKVAGFPGSTYKLIHQFNTAKFKLLNIDPRNIKTLYKKNFAMTNAAGMACIGDKVFYQSNEAPLSNERIIITDAIHSVQIRVIDAPYPILSPKEYSRLANASEAFSIHLPTGTIWITDGDRLIDRPQIEAHINPGRYKLIVYTLASRVDEQLYCFCFVPVTTTSA